MKYSNYLRRCRECENFYRTTSKYSHYCGDCRTKNKLEGQLKRLKKMMGYSFVCYHCKEFAQDGIARLCPYCGCMVHKECMGKCPNKRRGKWKKNEKYRYKNSTTKRRI